MSRVPSAGPSRPPSAAPRPRTAMSNRPPSTRPGTAMGGRASTIFGGEADLGEWIVAIFQGRGAGLDIGIASYCVDTGKIVLTQFADNQDFPKTFHHLSSHPPSVLLVPDTFLSSAQLSAQAAHEGEQAVQAQARSNYFNKKYNNNDGEASELVLVLEDKLGLDCTGLARKQWDSEAGFSFITQHISNSSTRSATLQSAQPNYYALCSVAALMKYNEVNEEVTFKTGTMDIQYKTLKGTCFIDAETVRDLELIRNGLGWKKGGSLFALLNETQTRMGYRKLKSDILQPSTLPEVVHNKLNVIEELMSNEDLYKDLKAAVGNFKNLDLDRLGGQLSATCHRADPKGKAAETRLSLILSLRDAVRSVEPLKDSLTNARSELLRQIKNSLGGNSFQEIDVVISDILNEDVILSLKGKTKSVNSKLMAVRQAESSLLATARRALDENYEDIKELLEAYNREYEDLNIQQMFQGNAFLFWVKVDELEGRLPQIFRNVRKQGKKFVFTSSELMKINLKVKETREEIYSLSDEVVMSTIDEIVEHITCLHAVASAVAQLDVLVSLAEVSIAHGYIRPEFTGTLAIQNGRHPILDKLLPKGTCIPNNTYAVTNSSTFQLIQGANMAGKSTYLRQVGLLTVMAMCGCYVPASYASFIFHDALLTRLSNDDSMEKCLSTFAAEMATSSMILGLATSKSLVLIDELGRGTSPNEGIGLSHAIAEELIKSKAYVFFATHFKDLATTLTVYPSVEVSHLHTQSKPSSTPSSSFSTTFTYKKEDGPCKVDHYGLELAKLASLPENVLKRAKKFAEGLRGEEEKGKQASETRAIAARRKVLLTLQSQINQVLTSSFLSPDALKEYLKTLQASCIDGLREALETREAALEALEEVKRMRTRKAKAGNGNTNGYGKFKVDSGEGIERDTDTDEEDEELADAQIEDDGMQIE